MAWTTQYEADGLPDAATPAWTKSGDATTIENSPAGYLRVVASDETLGYLLADSNLIDATGVTMETRMKVVSGQPSDVPTWANPSANFLIDATGGANRKEYSFWLFTDAIVYYPSENSYSLDTTDDYHTYRITAKDGSCNLYIDGVLRMTEDADDTTAVAGIQLNPEAIGASGIETSWDYVYYRTDGAVPPKNQQLKQSKYR